MNNEISITGTTSKIDSICFMYDTSIGSVFIVWPSISIVAGKSLIVRDAALKHASAKNKTQQYCSHSITKSNYLMLIIPCPKHPFNREVCPVIM